MALRQRMRELGYVEGQNVVFEPRWGRGDDDRMPKLAAELIGLKVDIVVTGGSHAVRAAKRATATIPIVMATGSDLAIGVVASLRQPGGNITGLTSINSELASKRLELLRSVAPRASRVAILWDETDPGSRLGEHETEAAAQTAGLTIQSVPVKSAAGLEGAFATVGPRSRRSAHRRQHLEALPVPQSDRRARPKAPPADARRLP
jgi:putative ABC transport system substrate-binding protein